MEQYVAVKDMQRVGVRRRCYRGECFAVAILNKEERVKVNFFMVALRGQTNCKFQKKTHQQIEKNTAKAHKAQQS